MTLRLPSLTSKLRLALALSVILCLSVVSISLINYRVARETVRNEVLNSSLPLTRDTIYSDIHGAMMEPIHVSSLMAHDTFLKDWSLDGERDIDAVRKYLTEIKNKYGYFSAFFVSARTGRYYHFDGVLKTIDPGDAHDVWYYDFVRSGAEHELTVDTNEAEGNALTIFINFRMLDAEGRLLGVTGVGVKMSQVAELLERTQARYHKRILLADRSGVVQLFAGRTSLEKRSLWEMEGLRDVARLVLDDRMPAANHEYDAGGRHYLLASRYVPDLTWFLLVEEDETASLAQARINLYRTLGIGLFMSLLVIAVSLGAVHAYQKRLETLVREDDLTGLANRREFERQFAVAAYLRQRRQSPVALIVMDIDGFKTVNDRHGHLAGDRLLKAMADLARSALRPSDCLARWGGDEFVALVLLPQEQALAVAERIRRLVAEARWPGPSEEGVSLSCGVAELTAEDSLDTIMHRADLALYRAKQSGRNRVEAAASPKRSAETGVASDQGQRVSS